LRSRTEAEKTKLDSRAEDLVETESLAGQQSPNLGSAQTLTGQQNPDLDSAHSQSRQEKSSETIATPSKLRFELAKNQRPHFWGR